MFFVKTKKNKHEKKNMNNNKVYSKAKNVQTQQVRLEVGPTNSIAK